MKWLVLLLLLGSFIEVVAQMPSPEIVEPAQPALVPGLNLGFLNLRQNAETGTLEPVVRAAEPDMLVLYTTQTYYHINNVFLTAANPQQANVWVGAVGLSFVPYSTYRWTPRLTLEGSLVRFDTVSRVNYNMQTVAFDNRLGLTDDNLLSWNFSASALRSESEQANPGEFYKRVEVVNNLNWFIPLDHNGRWFWHISPGLAWRSAEPSFENRLDAGGVLGLVWLPIPKLGLEPFFEGGYAYFPNDAPTLVDRRDVHLRGGASLFWNVSKHGAFTVSAFWLGNYSSASGANYQLLPSVTLNARIGF